MLLDAGANPNIRDNLGGCALQEAVKAGRPEMVEVGLAGGDGPVGVGGVCLGCFAV
jgi:hypothetical protein